MQIKELSRKIIQQKRVSISRALTIVENDLSNSSELLQELIPYGGKSKIFGITGAPGAGKSSLINNLISNLIKDNYSIAVLAVDPSSPFSGGAILGDRARMYSSALEEKIYIRSTASRGQLGGLSPRTPEMLNVLDAAGFDIIIIETVGVGQAELDIMKCADLVTLVLSTHTGDALQAIKAGIIEIADIFALNKADLPGINDLERDLLMALSLGDSLLGHSSLSTKTSSPNIFKVSINTPEMVSMLQEEMLKKHKEFESLGLIKERKKSALRFQFERATRERISSKLLSSEKLKSKRDKLLEKTFLRKITPRRAAEELVRQLGIK